MLVTAAISLAVALFMRNRLDDLASIVNFGALSGFCSCTCRCWRDLPLSCVRAPGEPTGWCRVCGIVVVLAVFSGMSALAAKVGCLWLSAGLLYGALLKAKHREELRAPL